MRLLKDLTKTVESGSDWNPEIEYILFTRNSCKGGLVHYCNIFWDSKCMSGFFSPLNSEGVQHLKYSTLIWGYFNLFYQTDYRQTSPSSLPWLLRAGPLKIKINKPSRAYDTSLINSITRMHLQCVWMFYCFTASFVLHIFAVIIMFFFYIFQM